MSHDLALGIVGTARMLEAWCKSKRRCASLRFRPSEIHPWIVVVPTHGTTNDDVFAVALNYLADQGFYVSPTKVEDFFAGWLHGRTRPLSRTLNIFCLSFLPGLICKKLVTGLVFSITTIKLASYYIVMTK